ncbi:MAG: hypothetical protein WCI77_04930 [Candidatus Omnitrophota bacterium]
MGKEAAALIIIGFVGILFIFMTLKDKKTRKQHNKKIADFKRFMSDKGFQEIDRFDGVLSPAITILKKYGYAVHIEEAFRLTADKGNFICKVRFLQRGSPGNSQIVAIAPAKESCPNFVLLHLKQVEGRLRTVVEKSLNLSYLEHLTRRQLPWQERNNDFTLYCNESPEFSSFLSDDLLQSLSAKINFMLSKDGGIFLIRELSITNRPSSYETDVNNLLEIVSELT